MVKVTEEGLFPVPRDKVWRRIEAHGTGVQTIHPNIKSTKLLDKETTTIDQTQEINGQIPKTSLRATPNPPDKLTLEFLEGPMTGKIINTYTETPGGTEVVTEWDMRSQLMDDKQLEGAIRQVLSDTFEEDLRYLKTKLQ